MIAFWSAASDVLPTATMHGCGFHWAQCIVKKIKSAGLSSAFTVSDKNNQLLRMLLAMQFLPAEHIPPTLDYLRQKSEDHRWINLCEYFQQTWIFDWDPTTWSSYSKAIRTNNDVEAWHRRLNTRYIFYCRFAKPFFVYMLTLWNKFILIKI